MRKIIIVCDRCKKEIEKIYQINVENVDADGFVQINAADKFGINGKDLCEKCVEEIAEFVKVAPVQQKIDKEKAVKMRQNGKTNSEIAEVMGVTPSSVAQLFSRMRKNGSIEMYQGGRKVHRKEKMICTKNLEN